MSGTSLDGLDLCFVEFNFDGNWSFKISATECIEYDSEWRAKLGNAHTLAPVDLAELNIVFGKYIGQHVCAFLTKFHLADPDLICSHGHTVFHDPANRYTLQIGSGDEIANCTGNTTISDFRTLDVSLGGQGAPLVPMGDELLFSEFDMCLNLGGFSNISYRMGDTRRAFDICPVNIALNPLANVLGKPYDLAGELARSGNEDEQLLADLNQLPVYSQMNRPSLSREWLEQAFLPIIQRSEKSIETKLRTVVEHAAQQISSVINAHAAGGSVLVTGGGAKNTFLMERISALSNTNVVIPESEIIDFKEALIFAFLGVLKYHGEINVLKSVTGAERDSSSGHISLPTK
ncbi:MAG: anhydro-N-acetylmuramic acid kinase [Flavobacteriales bacterium]|nr:anhydro-N-acetylmuramic acid kinase [Flavobacteriales bacterium]